MNPFRPLPLAFTLSLLFSCCSGSAVQAAFTIQTDLVGDPRTDNPDDLLVHLLIEVDDLSMNVSTWTIDLDSPVAHPNMKLDSFFANVVLPLNTKLVFSNPGPNGSGKVWDLIGGTNAPGSGSADFLFGIGQTGGGNPGINEVNNQTNLTFDLALVTDDIHMLPVNWQPSFLINSPLAVSSDTVLGSGQFGAHLQSLNTNLGQSNSGFALGVVPEPNALTSLGVLMLGVACKRRRTRRQ